LCCPGSVGDSLTAIQARLRHFASPVAIFGDYI
jgi:hypothetical protein